MFQDVNLLDRYIVTDEVYPDSRLNVRETEKEIISMLNGDRTIERLDLGIGGYVNVYETDYDDSWRVVGVEVDTIMEHGEERIDVEVVNNSKIFATLTILPDTGEIVSMEYTQQQQTTDFMKK